MSGTTSPSVILDQPVTKQARFVYSEDVHTKSDFTALVYAAVGAETKIRIRELSHESVFRTHPTRVLLTGMGHGTTNNTRIGDWIQPVSLDAMITMEGDTHASDERDFEQVRVGFLMYKADASTDFFNPDDLIANVDFPMGPYALTGKGKWEVLWDAYASVSNNSSHPDFLQTMHCSLDLSSLPRCTFRDALIGRNALYFFALSSADVPLGPVLPTNITMSTQVLYTDS